MMSLSISNGYTTILKRKDFQSKPQNLLQTLSHSPMQPIIGYTS